MRDSGRDANDLLLDGAAFTVDPWPAWNDTNAPAMLPRLPEAFWLARPFLQQIRSFARFSEAAPDAVLLQAMARAAIAAPPSAAIMTSENGDVSPLSMFVVTIARSGVGKSTATRATRRLVSIDGDEPPLDLPLGSGEGLAEAFMGADPAAEEKKSFSRIQVRHRAHFHVDEGEALVRLLRREASTLGETLRRAFTGEVLGQKNASADRTRVVREYRLCLTINATAGVVGDLLRHAELGLPQRFLWAGALDPEAPQHPAREPMPMLRNLPGHAICFSPAIQDEIAEQRWRARRGELVVDELDTHVTLMRCRVAAVLAAWADREVVEDDDWALAGIVLDTSRAVRAWAIAAAEQCQAEKDTVEAERRGRCAQTVRAMVMNADGAVARLAQRVGRKVHRRNGATLRELTHSCTKAADRHLLRAAIDYAEAAGWITPPSADGLYQPGKSRPAP
jgi:hypothetical protein